MAISLFCAVRWPLVADAPVVPATVGAPMALPQKIHPVVDYDVRAWSTHEIYGRERVDTSCRCKDMAGGRAACAVARRGWPPLVVEVVATANRIEYVTLEKHKQ